MISVGKGKIGIGAVVRVARGLEKVQLTREASARMGKSLAVVDRAATDGKRIYGVTTGFGALSDTLIPARDLRRLQHNIILSHAAGVGTPLSKDVVRAAMLIRAHTLALGYSGVRPEVVQLLVDMLNSGVHPIVPKKGSLGASGDLAPLAHIALVMIGGGNAELHGQIIPGRKALAKAGLEPIKLMPKEGLSLVNGTQVMAAVASLSIADAKNLLSNADVAGAMSAEALRSNFEEFELQAHKLRPHAGQLRCASNINALIKGSSLIGSGGRTQDPYSIRCIPQVNGAVSDTIDFCYRIVETEINSVTDNPIVLPESGHVVSCGNFHGEYLAFAMDFLAIAVSELADMSERRIARLIDSKLSGLKPFLINDAGVNSGFMIAHYSAASLVSENKVLSHPASVDSIPTSANQEDHVSMGGISANKLMDVMENVTNVLAIECLCATQALDMLDGKLGKGVQAAHDSVRKRIKFMEKDEEMHLLIGRCAEMVRRGDIVRAAEEKTGLLL